MNATLFTIIGYSGHAYVVIESAKAAGRPVTGYFDHEEKVSNPYDLAYYGFSEMELENAPFFSSGNWLVAIGQNAVRSRIQLAITSFFDTEPAIIIHPTAHIAIKCEIGAGTFIATNAVIHPLTRVGKGVICNTGAIIEHECRIGDFAHIAPGAVLAGNVSVGKQTFIGANSVCRQGISIGAHCTIGAGAVVVKDIPDYSTVVGNPARILHKK